MTRKQQAALIANEMQYWAACYSDFTLQESEQL